MYQKNNITTYSYHHESLEFGQYDIMFPQTTKQTHKEVKFSCDVDLDEYFNQFIKFLLEVGFKEKEIEFKISQFALEEEWRIPWESIL